MRLLLGLQLFGPLEGADLGLGRILLDDLTVVRDVFEDGDVLQVIDADAGSDEMCGTGGADSGAGIAYALRRVPQSRALDRQCADSINHIL